MKKSSFFLLTCLNSLCVFISAVVSARFNSAENPFVNFITFLPSLLVSVSAAYICITKKFELTISDVVIPIVVYLVIGSGIEIMAFFIMSNLLHRVFIATYSLFLTTIVFLPCLPLKKHAKNLLIVRIATFFAYFVLLLSIPFCIVHCFTPVIKISTPEIYTAITAVSNAG